MNAIVGSPALISIDQAMQRRLLSPQQNHLLASLAPHIQESLFPQLEPCKLAQGTVLAKPGMATSHFYFPVDALVSRHCLAEDEAGTAMSVVGNDGAIGLDLLMENGTAPTVSVVQVAGYAFRIEGRRLKREMDRHEELLAVLSQQSHATLTQMAQTAVCNRHHTLEQQLCRWLLLALDRLPGDDFRMSMDQIAQALGVKLPRCRKRRVPCRRQEWRNVSKDV